MSYQFIGFSVADAVGTIALNRPKEMNSLNFEIIGELRDALDECGKREDVRAVVLTGSNHVFSAGDDIKIMRIAEGKSEAEISAMILGQGYPSVVKKILALWKPVIASVDGVCFGAGGELAMACDYVIASDKAKFGQLYVGLGLIGNTYLLPKQAGLRKALDLLWSGEIVPAGEALRIGMINEVVEGSLLEAKTREKALRLAAGPTLAYGAAKAGVYASVYADLEEGFAAMTKVQGRLMKSEDHREGVKAFFEKRKAAFGGK